MVCDDIRRIEVLLGYSVLEEISDPVTPVSQLRWTTSSMSLLHLNLVSVTQGLGYEVASVGGVPMGHSYVWVLRVVPKRRVRSDVSTLFTRSTDDRDRGVTGPSTTLTVTTFIEATGDTSKTDPE